jgi:peptidyl-tRNA hydrolase
MAADPTLRLYAIVRGDLEMTAGKLSSQSGHAFLDAFIAAKPDLQARYQEYGHGTKVVLVAYSTDSIMEARDAAVRLNLPHALVIDSGHIMPPHFTGEPILTALGIGPCLRSDAFLITQGFELLR